MRNIRVFAVTLALTLTSLVTVLSSNAVAASDYDNVVMSGGNAIVTYTNPSTGSIVCSADVTHSWMSILSDVANWNSSSGVAGAIDDLETVIDNGSGFAVMQYKMIYGGSNGTGVSYGPNSSYVGVFWSATNDTASFVTRYSYPTPYSWPELKPNGTFNYAVIQYDYTHGCQPRVVASLLGFTSGYDIPLARVNNPWEEDDIPGGELFADIELPVFINYDIDYASVSGYAGEYPSTYEDPAKYVAMGDSFSSGEGNPVFEYGTDVGGVNKCHRSPKAHPRLLNENSNLNLGTMAFVACSGATTSSVLLGHSGKGNWSEGPQINALSASTELVTVTIGGNDVDFEGYAESCGAPLYSCGIGTTAYDDMMDRINSPSFEAALEETYTDILEVADNATVYVLDYPYMVDPTGVDGVACEPLVNLSAAVPVQMALNSVIEDAVDNVRDLDPNYYGRLIYMPTNYFGSPFIDHHLCTDDPGGTYFNGLNLSNREYSFHPNVNGQQAYYQIMEDYLS